jgi:hypothetical protein
LRFDALREEMRPDGARLIREKLALLELRKNARLPDRRLTKSDHLEGRDSRNERALRAPKGRRHLRRTAPPIAPPNVAGKSPTSSQLMFERIAMLDGGVDRVLKSEIGGLMFAISRDAGGWAAFPLHNNLLDLLCFGFLAPLVMKFTTKWCK